LRWLALQLVILLALVTIAADLAAHKRVETLGGVNIWGYRGPVAHQRQSNELRVVFVGGTRAFGWGEPASGTTVATVRFELTRVLDRPGRPVQTITAINLGQLGAASATYTATLAHFAYLRPDFIGILDDLGDPGPNRPFDRSGIFALTGYRPMLPLVLQEKGHVTHARLLGAPLEYLGDALALADRALARVTAAAGTLGPGDPPTTTSPDAYVSSMLSAIRAAHAEARGVVLALGPIDSDVQRRNFDALRSRLSDLRDARWLRIVSLSDEPDLYDPSLRLDAFSFGASATAVAARAIAPAFLELISGG
jgi:hypothetical protein